MNRCLRSLSCLLTLSALALFSTDATARTNPKQQPPQKTHEATQEVATTRPRKRAPHRNAAVEKRRHAKHADAKKQVEAGKGLRLLAKEAVAPLTGDLALVKEAIDLARKAKTDEATATREQDHRSGGAETRRMVHPAPFRDHGEFQPLCRVHRRQPGMAERGVAAPAGGGAAVAGAQRCGHGSRLHGR